MIEPDKKGLVAHADELSLAIGRLSDAVEKKNKAEVRRELDYLRGYAAATQALLTGRPQLWQWALTVQHSEHFGDEEPQEELAETESTE